MFVLESFLADLGALPPKVMTCSGFLVMTDCVGILDYACLDGLAISFLGSYGVIPMLALAMSNRGLHVNPKGTCVQSLMATVFFTGGFIVIHDTTHLPPC